MGGLSATMPDPWALGCARLPVLLLSTGRTKKAQGLHTRLVCIKGQEGVMRQIVVFFLDLSAGVMPQFVVE